MDGLGWKFGLCMIISSKTGKGSITKYEVGYTKKKKEKKEENNFEEFCDPKTGRQLH